MTGVVRTSEPKHSNELLRKSVGERKLRRGSTQRELSEAIGGGAELALRGYELVEWWLKQKSPNQIELRPNSWTG